jgi:hypothetical protein
LIKSSSAIEFQTGSGAVRLRLRFIATNNWLGCGPASDANCASARSSAWLGSPAPRFEHPPDSLQHALDSLLTSRHISRDLIRVSAPQVLTENLSFARLELGHDPLDDLRQHDSFFRSQFMADKVLSDRVVVNTIGTMLAANIDLSRREWALDQKPGDFGYSSLLRVASPVFAGAALQRLAGGTFALFRAALAFPLFDQVLKLVGHGEPSAIGSFHDAILSICGASRSQGTSTTRPIAA